MFLKKKLVDGNQEAVKAQRQWFPLMEAGSKKKTVKIRMES